MPKPAITACERLALAEAVAFAKKLENGGSIIRSIMQKVQEHKAEQVN
jgi:hypothetical protein